eukprot:gb/GFBE01013831.1/.p1 GENE.gb/GFBE01013831.1/~~gb/GFBE01013831.1/.p1  ORF type:complete len:211 (+),score=36.25 gb/GFBE01013831.1/:1-633(+)
MMSSKIARRPEPGRGNVGYKGSAVSADGKRSKLDAGMKFAFDEVQADAKDKKEPDCPFVVYTGAGEILHCNDRFTDLLVGDIAGKRPHMSEIFHDSHEYSKFLKWHGEQLNKLAKGDLKRPISLPMGPVTLALRSRDGTANGTCKSVLKIDFDAESYRLPDGTARDPSNTFAASVLAFKSEKRLPLHGTPPVLEGQSLGSLRRKITLISL